MTILKGTPDCQGLLAWQRLHRRYSPRTMARAIRLMTEVASPGRVTKSERWGRAAGPLGGVPVQDGEGDGGREEGG